MEWNVFMCHQWTFKCVPKLGWTLSLLSLFDKWQVQVLLCRKKRSYWSCTMSQLEFTTISPFFGSFYVTVEFETSTSSSSHYMADNIPASFTTQRHVIGKFHLVLLPALSQTLSLIWAALWQRWWMEFLCTSAGSHGWFKGIITLCGIASPDH